MDLDPAIFSLGHFALRWDGLGIAAASVVGFWLAWREARRKGLLGDEVFDVGLTKCSGIWQVVSLLVLAFALPAVRVALHNGRRSWQSCIA